MKKLLVHTTATALLLSQLGFSSSVFAAENESASKTDLNHKEEAPALVKGDFFYFVKTTVEKIQLLLTTDKVKEAELLAEFAQERIHEARELIKEGKEDLAKETIKEALGQMENAQGQLEGKLPTITEPTTTEKTTAEDNATTKPAEASTEVEKQGTEKEDTEKHEKQKLTKEQKEIAKIQHHLNNNLLVLADVLDKVKNPKAKAAIAKNIEKSFNKISERLEKVLKHEEKNSTALKPVITIQYPDGSTENSDTPEVITTITKIEDVNDTDVKNVNEDVKDTDVKNVNEDDQGENDDKDDAAEVSTKPVKVEYKEEHHQHISKKVKVAKVKKVKVEKEEKAERHEVKKHEAKKHEVKKHEVTNHRNRGEHENRGNHKGNEKHEWKKNENSNDQGENHGNGHDED
ncbi:DUF5667 domain-containing protein [Gottfriedia sp. NPDC056225]|uniref:DUF5667 domain-containing protein n=1 Tax=Gottfriedia sp. NPDC056225 TaxID=3345751 RepID=UPI0035D6B267